MSAYGLPVDSDMAFTLYGYERNPRSRVVRIVAAAEGIELNHYEVIPRLDVNKAAYKARFPLSRGKIPGLEGPNIKLTETLAIVTYLAKFHNRSKLLGDGSLEEEAKILSWASWANQEFLQTAAQWFLPLIPSFTDRPPYNYDAVAAGKKATLEIVEFLDTLLATRRYIVIDHLTVADIMIVIYLSRLFEWVLDRQWREQHPSLMRYFETVARHDAVKKVIPRQQFILIDVETPNEDPGLKSN